MEEVDVAIIGAGLAGLATAIAFKRIAPGLVVKVLEARPPPAAKYGGFVKIQANGLRAARAIDPRLEEAIKRAGMPEKPLLLHSDDGRLIGTGIASASSLTSPLNVTPALVTPSTSATPTHPGAGLKVQVGSFKPDSAVAPAPEGPGSSHHHDHDGGSSSSSSSSSHGDWSTHGGHHHHHSKEGESIIIGWWELEQLLLSMLPPHTVEYSASFLKLNEASDGVVALFEGLAYPLKAQILIGADGPFSGVRAQCVQDGEPAFDRSVKWVGRLDGHHVGTTPLDFAAFFVRKGQVFISHPMRNGDVAFEALVTEQALEMAGYEFDEGLGRVIPSADAAALKEKGEAESILPSTTLSKLFEGWPRAVQGMLSAAPPESILEGGVFIRSPADMPPALGRGRVALVGEAAHPLRPTGHDASASLEDAYVLAAFVQSFGLGKEALRRYDNQMRPRWRLTMQISQAQGATTATGIGISRGLFDYAQDLFKVDFEPLQAPEPEPKKRGRWGHTLAFTGKALRLALTAGLWTAGIITLFGLVPERHEMNEEYWRAEAVGRRGYRRVSKAVRTTLNKAGEQAVEIGGPALEHAKHLTEKVAKEVAEAAQPAVEQVQHAVGKVAQVVKPPLVKVEHAVEERAEAATGKAIDAGTHVVKKTVQHKLASALGAF